MSRPEGEKHLGAHIELPAAPLYKRVNWLHVFIQLPMYMHVGLLATQIPLRLQTSLLTLVYIVISGVCITAGYHRLWSHKSYQAAPVLRYLLAGIGAGALQTPITKWARHHRAHHRYIDTAKDPYNAKKGLIWSHVGWMLFQNEVPWGKVDISDLESDSAVIWQERNYLVLLILSGWILPAAIAHFGWNDFVGGLFYGGSLRIVLGWQFTSFVNSLAHWKGSQPFSNKHTARDNFWVALITFGEGYHNFHHTFPSDYRNGAQWYDIDVSKWFIWLWEKTGLASHVKRITVCEIEEARNGGAERSGENDVKLPVMEWEHYIEAVKKGQDLVVIAGFVHDVNGFVDEHPGGASLINQARGKDATSMFHGGTYDHSSHAHNVLRKLRFAVIRGGGETDSKYELMDHRFVLLR